MATDNQSAIAGNYPGGIKQTCILNEGAPTIKNTGYFDQQGKTMKVLTWATEIAEGDIVAINNDTDNTYAATGGIPLVEKPVTTEAFVIGEVVSTPKLQNFPANDAAANDLDERLTGKYYRTAVVEIWGGITKIIKAKLTTIETHTVVPGVVTKINFDISETYTDHKLCCIVAAANGVGAIPFHYVVDAAAGDEYSCLLGITGMLYAVT